jgi:3-methylcrotonyl-CoA carboxylase alpha subunit
VCWGASRDAALAELEHALAVTRIDGIWSNIGFLRRVVTHDAFRAGDVFTGFIEAFKNELIA